MLFTQLGNAKQCFGVGISTSRTYSFCKVRPDSVFDFRGGTVYVRDRGFSVNSTTVTSFRLQLIK